MGTDGVHTVCPAVDAALDESAALAALPQDTLAPSAADVQEMAEDFKVKERSDTAENTQHFYRPPTCRRWRRILEVNGTV